MKKIYLITHGDRKYGANVGHTEKGIEQIKSLSLPEHISLVVIGTGKRFQEIYEMFSDKLMDIPTVYSPFAGSADSFDENKNLVLADGTVVPGKNYIGLKRIDAFDPWLFLSILSDQTLLLSGGELLGALGFGAIDKKGSIYEIDVENREAKKLN